MNATAKERITNYEAPAMNRKFPQFKLFRIGPEHSFAPDGEMFWGGYLKTNFGTEYGAAIVYPRNYPNDRIRAYIPELKGHVNSRHMYVDGHLCLYSNDHSGAGEGVGDETTATTVTAWTAAWLNAWEVYQRTGRWPGKE
ncbi:hypothetical protein FACS1894187_13570 [Synergistales bacterium]|nr:hypothetical protein AGMMS50276_00080 [Synergistales bacterium]GHV37269.1 hypothetical protein FACS1894187_13570 [Synergistales bacterium]